MPDFRVGDRVHLAPEHVAIFMKQVVINMIKRNCGTVTRVWKDPEKPPSMFIRVSWDTKPYKERNYRPSQLIGEDIVARLGRLIADG